MRSYVAKRLALIAAVLFGVTLITFGLMHLAPGDPAVQIAEARYGTDLTWEQVEEIRIAEGFDRPWYVQYKHWMEHLFNLDLGRSLTSGKDVSHEISARLPATLLLAGSSLLLSLAISFGVGTWCALNRDTWKDRLGLGMILLGKSIPSFWLGLLLMLVFSVWLGILPSYGTGGIQHLILPSVTLALGMAAVTTRLVRSSLLEVMNEDYILMAQANGLEEGEILRHHGLRNAMLPVLTFAGVQLGFLIGGTMVVETVFSWPGIGKLLVDSILIKDFALVQGCVLVVALIFCLITLLIDVLYAVIDPRVRYDL